MARLVRSNPIRDNITGILIGSSAALVVAAAVWFFLGRGGEKDVPPTTTLENVYICSSCGKEYVNDFPYIPPWTEYPTELPPPHELVEVGETYYNGSVDGATPVAMFQRVTGNLSASDDMDFYSFTVEVPGSVNFSFSFDGSDHGYTYLWDATVYGTNGWTVLMFGSIPSKENQEVTFSAPDLTPGTYYLKISRASGGNPFMNGYSDTNYHIAFLPECAEHVSVTQVLTIAPTCSQAGEFTSVCNICDMVLDPEPIEPLDHIWSTWKTLEEISIHSLSGKCSRTCALCGETETDSLRAHRQELDQRADPEVQVEPCPVNDAIENVCSVCGNVIAIGHTYGKWVTNPAATCSAEGQRSRTCTACDHVETEALERIPHTYGEAVRVSGGILDGPIVSIETCIVCGDMNRQESNWFWWVRPLIAVLGIAAVVIILVLSVRTVRRWRRKSVSKKQKKTFLCPHCFQRVQITRNAICPKCQKPLPESTLKGKDMIISVVGSRDTGKSHYITVIINELITRIAPAFGGSFESFDDTTIRTYENKLRKPLYESRVRFETTISENAYEPLIYSLKLPVKGFLREKVQLYTMVFFDSVGEDMMSEEYMKKAERYIRESSGIIFLIDPLKIPTVNAKLDESAVKRASSAAWYQPDNILVRVSNLLRKNLKLQSTDKIKVPVSVVFTKFDVIEPNWELVPEGFTIREPSPHCGESAFNVSDGHNVNEEVRSLLQDWGAKSFLTQLKMNYTSYSCFAVSSLGLHNNQDSNSKIHLPHPHRIEDPLLWILMKLKVIKGKK